MAKVLSLLLLFSLQTATADEQTPPELSPVQVLLPLFMVVCLIFILAWLLRKMNIGTPAIGKEIKIVANAAVSPQARVCLVRVGGKDILLGVTHQHVEHLHTFDDPVLPSEDESNTSELSDQFRKLLKRGE